MEFRLVYEGPLPSGSRQAHVSQKHAIRRALHPQLRELWRTHPALEGTRINQHFMEEHLLPNHQLGTFRFVPLVSSAFSLTCSLEILFLRPESPGRLVQGGDLDNRIKVLFDGLRLPRNTEELGAAVPGDDEDPFYCLLEDDCLVAGFQVTSDRLLKGGPAGLVHLVIKVVTSSLSPGQVGVIP